MRAWKWICGIIAALAIAATSFADTTTAAATHGRRMRPEAGPAAWSTGTYQYDPSGNITAIGQQYFVYDMTGQLVTATTGMPVEGQPDALETEQFVYDDFGNMTSRTFSGVTTDIPTNSSTNHMAAFSAQYDGAGNVTSVQPPGSTQAYAYDYDSFNQRRDLRVGTNAANAWVVDVYTADDERLWHYDILANVSHWTLRDLSGKVLRDFKNNGNAPAAAAWSVARDYVYRDGLLLAAITPDHTEHFTLDHLGTPRLITDDSGVRIGLHAYRAFGNERTNATPQESASMKFTGHERDSDPLGLLSNDTDYMHARYYGANLGRFLSVDPVLEADRTMHNPQLWNRYAYVGNSPLNRVDPDGQADAGIELLWNRLKHVINNHVDKNSNLQKSTFIANNPKDVQKLIEKTVKPQNLVKTQADGRKVYERTFNKPVGTEGETTVRAVTEPVAATREKVITGFPTMNTLASIMDGVGILDTAVNIYGYQRDFVNQYGRKPTFNESMRFMVTGDRRSDGAVLIDAMHEEF